jgi:hypothetical protein
MRTDSQRILPPVIGLIAQHGEGEEKALHLAPQDAVSGPVLTRLLAARPRAAVEGINA